MTDDEAIYHGARAVAFLPTLDAAVERAEQVLLDTWKATGPERTATREKLHSAVTLLPMVRGALVEIITAGQAAKHRTAMAALTSPAVEDRR